MTKKELLDIKIELMKKILKNKENVDSLKQSQDNRKEVFKTETNEKKGYSEEGEKLR